MTKPTVLTKCVANHYASDNERIIEYSDPNSGKGGLISFRIDDKGRLSVNLYRHDKDIIIRVGKGE